MKRVLITGISGSGGSYLAEQILERQGGGQRKLFYTSDGGEEYVSFADQAERLARLLFENQ